MSSFVSLLHLQIHIDIPRMSPEALTLQPRVTEVRASEVPVQGVSLCRVVGAHFPRKVVGAGRCFPMGGVHVVADGNPSSFLK